MRLDANVFRAPLSLRPNALAPKCLRSNVVDRKMVVTWRKLSTVAKGFAIATLVSGKLANEFNSNILQKNIKSPRVSKN